MIKSNEFKDYILLDAGDKEKLESWNGIILRRPDPQIIWNKTDNKIWNNYDAIYHRSKNALADEELVVFNPNDIHIMGTS